MKKFLKWFGGFVALILLSQVFFYWQATRSPQWEYARRALECKKPNYDLTYCVDLPASDRKDFTHSSFKPLVCINTASSCYNYRHRAGNCNSLKAHPDRWKFREVSADEAVPGDLMLFVTDTGRAPHAGVYTMNSLLGPLCANTIGFGIFFHYMPIKPIMWLRVARTQYTHVKYYRYYGESVRE